MPSGANGEWVNILSDNLSVKSLEFTPAPNLSSKLSWKDPGNLLQNQSIRFRLILGYSWKSSRLTGGSPPSITIQTTINLIP